MRRNRWAIAAILFTALCCREARAGELQAGTLTAWNEYVKRADLRLQQRASGGLPLLWMDESVERVARVRSGEVTIAPVAGRGVQAVPHGLIHDWIGAIFIPGATIAGLLAVVHNYDNYRRIYEPAVAFSKTLACTDRSQEFQMVWQRKLLLVSAALQGHYRAHDVPIDSHRGYSIAESVEVREIEEYGRMGERLLAPDTGNGFIWRIRSMARYEERDGGVYLELEAMALTRDIPSSLAWMVKPLVNHLSINSLTTTLRQTRDAVMSLDGHVEAVSSCRALARKANPAKFPDE